MNMTKDFHLARYLDHTLLKPTATLNDIRQLCQEAIQYDFRSVCINACYLPLASEQLKASEVYPISVIGFPLGATLTEAKIAEAELAIANGAREIDMVMNLGLLKSGEFSAAENDLRRVVRACENIVVKVIIETALLSHQEKIQACQISEAAGAAFVKTCSGFSGGSATTEDVKLMRASVGPGVQIKASGGIRSRETALALIEAGATRLGTSSGVAIVTGAAPAPMEY